MAIAATPINRATSATQTTGMPSVTERADVTSPMPKTIAAAPAKPAVVRLEPPRMAVAPTSIADGAIEARTTPRTMRPSIVAATGPSGSPRKTAMTAAMAPSVEAIGAAMPTGPIVSARYAR